ncbi:MAG: hypothetical protein GF416_06870 [Candidatus Altiarchaeales archaeon]|nr:hypothetical protein [Candidatus Altiarchaeales archaeon]MBD3416835.1 hypothetical protein [Candidatus Altiarchaeales archaeon]
MPAPTTERKRENVGGDELVSPIGEPELEVMQSLNVLASPASRYGIERIRKAGFKTEQR